MTTITTFELKGPLPDFYEFSAQQKAKAQAAIDAKFSTPELQLSELLEAAREAAKYLAPLAKHGVELKVMQRLRETVANVEARR